MTGPRSVDVGDLDWAGPSGAIWSLPHGGDLDANIVVIRPGEGVGAHANVDVDVLIVGLSGRGVVTVDGETVQLRAGSLAHVPKGATRAIAQSGDDPLLYATVHRSRPGLGVHRR